MLLQNSSIALGDNGDDFYNYYEPEEREIVTSESNEGKIIRDVLFHYVVKISVRIDDIRIYRLVYLWHQQALMPFHFSLL